VLNSRVSTTKKRSLSTEGTSQIPSAFLVSFVLFVVIPDVGSDKINFVLFEFEREITEASGFLASIALVVKMCFVH
jgi:hypothetical protein